MEQGVPVAAGGTVAVGGTAVAVLGGMGVPVAVATAVFVGVAVAAAQPSVKVRTMPSSTLPGSLKAYRVYRLPVSFCTPIVALSPAGPSGRAAASGGRVGVGIGRAPYTT